MSSQVTLLGYGTVRLPPPTKASHQPRGMELSGSGPPHRNARGSYMVMGGMSTVFPGDLVVYVSHLALSGQSTQKADEQDQIASAAYDRILRVWDVESAKQIRTFSGHTQSTLAVDYDNTGKLLASG